jgi:hypothetical protein
MTREELQQYFTEVIHVGYEKYPIWQLLEKYYTIEGVSRYYLPVEHCECTWVVTVSFGDCCGRYTHDRLHDEDFHLKSNQALKGDWLLKPGAGFWKIVSDGWVQKAKEIDIFELDMHEVTREEMEKRFNSEHPYPPIDIDGRPLMHFVQHLKAMKPEGSYDYFYNLGNGIKVYSCDTPETLAERIIGHEQTLEEMLEEQYKGRELPQFWKNALERRKEQQEEKPEDEVIPAAIETEQEI